MCGIIGTIAGRPAQPILLEGLRRLEYRGYDSAGIALIDNGQLQRTRRQGRLAALEAALAEAPLAGHTGIGHTRWATHGAPSEANAHPHIAGDLALVHNGIIENHAELRAELEAEGHAFCSETDTEVLLRLIHHYSQAGDDPDRALYRALARVEGAYAIGMISAREPDRLFGARSGSPLLVGWREGEVFLASDQTAFAGLAEQFQVLDNGQVALLAKDRVRITDFAGKSRKVCGKPLSRSPQAVALGEHPHYMHKEIHEQGRAVAATLDGRLDLPPEACFGDDAAKRLKQIKSVQIIACGTSYYAGLLGQYWLESAGVPCRVDIASEFRSRAHVVPEHCLVTCLSQSGETRDTLSALEQARTLGYANTLAICNVAESSLMRETDLHFETAAGPEIGVASTKAFLTQLIGLKLLTLALGQHARLNAEQAGHIRTRLRQLPAQIERVLGLEPVIERHARDFKKTEHALYLGRGTSLPVALEGALKIKELSYIHAEAFPAGELKHGPLALVDEKMPVVALAPNDELLGRLKNNLAEVRARGGQLLVFADADAGIAKAPGQQVVEVPGLARSRELAPVLLTVPLQLLAYHVACQRGTDVDKPRNLAKSVTVD